MGAEHGSGDWPMTRRRFGALAASAAAALAFGGSRANAEPRAPAAPPVGLDPGGAAPVALAGVARGGGSEAVTHAVRRAALAATDFSWLSRGDSVLIKPACNSGNAYPATTDPVALAAMIQLLREKGAGRVLVADMSGVQFLRFSPDSVRGSTRALMQRNGMAQASLEAGAEVHAFEEPGWDAFLEERPTRGTSWKGAITLPAILSQVDHVVLMPRCSRHLLAGSTLGLKAAVGWWRHDSRLEYHHDAATFAEKTVEGNLLPTLIAKQRLVLSSAARVLTTFGPDEGYVLEPETGLVFAAPSVFAHDMVSLAWLLESRRATPEAARDSAREDPNRSALFVNAANRVVTGWLGGFGQALTTQWLERHDLDSIWDDRVLRHAFVLLGSVPRLELIDADGSLPASVHRQLVDATRPAA